MVDSAHILYNLCLVTVFFLLAPVDTPTAVNSATKSPTKNETSLTDNTMMAIKVAGQTYYVANKKKQHNKSHSLGSLSEFNIDLNKSKKYSSTNDDNKNGINQGIINNDNNNLNDEYRKNDKETDDDDKEISEIRDNSNENTNKDNVTATTGSSGNNTTININVSVNNGTEDRMSKSFGLAKSKSEGNPFNHKRKGKIIKIAERPRGKLITDMIK